MGTLAFTGEYRPIGDFKSKPTLVQHLELLQAFIIVNFYMLEKLINASNFEFYQTISINNNVV